MKKKVFGLILLLFLSIIVLFGCSTNKITHDDRGYYTKIDGYSYRTQPSVKWQYFCENMEEIIIGSASDSTNNYDLYVYENDEEKVFLRAISKPGFLSDMTGFQMMFYRSDYSFPSVDDIDSIQIYKTNYLKTGSAEYETASEIITDDNIINDITRTINNKITTLDEALITDRDYCIVMRNKNLSNVAIIIDIVKANNKYYFALSNGEYCSLPDSLAIY